MNRRMIVMISPLLWIAVTLTVCAAEVDSQPPASELKQSARRILAEPEFRRFEHFADDAFRKGEPAASEADSANGATANPDVASRDGASDSSNTGNEATASEPWWQRALNRAQQPGGDSGSSRKQRLSPKDSAPSGNSPSGQSGEGNGSSNAGTSSNPSDQPDAKGTNGQTRGSDNAAPSPVTGTSPSPERPSRAPSERPARATKPSQRGSDGVERPVRQASRTPRAPKPDAPANTPTWNGPSLGFAELLGGVFHGLAYLILAGIVIAIVILIAQALMQAWNERPRPVPGLTTVAVGPLTHDRSPGETESDVFVQEALSLARQGEFRAAIGRLVLGGMSFIERQQWIRYRRGLTVHDYLRVLRSRPEQFAGFRQVVHVFEPVEYGRRPATEPLFAAALAGYRRGFKDTSAVPDNAP